MAVSTKTKQPASLSERLMCEEAASGISGTGFTQNLWPGLPLAETLDHQYRQNYRANHQDLSPDPPGVETGQGFQRGSPGPSGTAKLEGVIPR